MRDGDPVTRPELRVIAGRRDDRAWDALRQAVREAGFRVSRDFPMDLPQDDDSYQRYIDLLATWLPRIPRPRAKEMVVRQFIDPRARRFNDFLLDQYAGTPPSEETVGFLIATGSAIRHTMTRANLSRVVELLGRAEYGFARVELPAALGRWKSDEADDLLIGLLTDPKIGFVVVQAVARRGLVRALPALRDAASARDHGNQQVYFARAIDRLEQLAQGRVRVAGGRP